jgi:HTH-type transcriptional regulator/antitoxin HigA
MMTPLLAKTVNHWHSVEDVLSIPHSEIEYQRMLSLLDELLNIVGDNETHILAGLLETLSTLIEVYEEEHYPVADAPAHEVLRFLMEEHDLTANDLPEIANQEDILNILIGQVQLNVIQIKNLSKRFHVSPVVFL